MNVLVFPCSTEIGYEVYRSLNGKKGITLIGMGSEPNNHVYENFISGCPYVTDKDFIRFLGRVIREYSIDVIYPANDLSLLYLKRNEDKLCRVVGPSLSIVEICNQKSSTYQLLQPTVRTPKVYTFEDVEFPCFLKPNIGHSSIGCKKIDSRLELAVQKKINKGDLILEYLPGDEYTIDCYSDKFFLPRIRKKIGNGIAVKTECIHDTLDRAKLFGMWRDIYKEFCFGEKKLDCAWFFQVKKDKNGEFCLMEVGARIAGSSSLSRLRNVNLPLIEVMGDSNIWPEVEIVERRGIDEISRRLDVKARFNFEFKSVYVDLDDTLIQNGKVNHKLVALIYKFRQQGRCVYLLTRREWTEAKILIGNMCIHPSIFNAIFSAEKGRRKDSYMDQGSILIDDSFNERRSCSYPSFDTDIVDSLL